MKLLLDKMLPYFSRALIVKGFGRGSKSLGTPTANLSEDVVNQLPKEINTGVYYGWAALEGQIYKMVMSIGWNPFFKNEKKSMEVHLLHEFEDDFYGKELSVIILGFIRPEKDFPSLDALIKEIKNDIKIAKERLDEPKALTFKNHEFLKG